MFILPTETSEVYHEYTHVIINRSVSVVKCCSVCVLQGIQNVNDTLNGGLAYNPHSDIIYSSSRCYKLCKKFSLIQVLP